VSVPRGWALAGTVGCVVAGILPALMTGGLAVRISEELGFGEARLGLAVAAFFLAAALTSAVLGRASELVGPGRALRWAGWASAASLLGVAAAARSFGSLVAFLVLGGVANAAAQPAANLVIVHAMPPGRQGLLFGLKQAAVPMATLLGGLAVPAVALTVGWRWAYAGSAVLALAASLLVPSTAPLRARGSEAAVPEAGVRLLALLTGGLACAAMATGCLAVFAVASGVEAGLSEGTAGYLASIGSAGAVAVFVLAGRRADRRPGRELLACTAMLAFGAAAMTALAGGASGLYFLAVPAAFTIGWGWPGLFNLAVVRSSPSAPGAATGITQTGAYAGSILGPSTFGYLAEHLSYRTAWLSASATSAVAAAVVYACHRALRPRTGLRRPRGIEER
jgi:MFS family permease